MEPEETNEKLPELDIQIVSTKIECKKRKLNKMWTVEVGGPVLMFDATRTRWQRFKDWVSRIVWKLLGLVGIKREPEREVKTRGGLARCQNT